jgi:hypothetical protein
MLAQHLSSHLESNLTVQHSPLIAVAAAAAVCCNFGVQESVIIHITRPICYSPVKEAELMGHVARMWEMRIN